MPHKTNKLTSMTKNNIAKNCKLPIIEGANELSTLAGFIIVFAI